MGERNDLVIPIRQKKENVLDFKASIAILSNRHQGLVLRI